MSDDEPYSNIREILGPLIGARVVDITQHDADEFAESQQAYVELLFDTGATLRFPVDETPFGFSEPD